MNSTPTRRRVLGAAGAVAATGLGGCLGGAGVGGSASDGSDGSPPAVDGTGHLGDPAESVTVEMASVPMPEIDSGIVHIEPGGTVEWVGTGIRNAVAAYHPETHEPLRIPEAGEPWVSEMLYDGDSFSVTIEEEGIYDYADTVVVCGSHESLGVVGRVVVGQPDLAGQPAVEGDPEELPGRATERVREFDERCRDILGDS
jgi:plastocyanin